jgi:DNA-binding winged helix-turn-helix (wHTH) protein
MGVPDDPEIYAFGPFRLDVQGETLFRGTEPVALSKRAVALLRMLVEHAGALVSKDALIEAAWPGLAIEESNLSYKLRQCVGHSARCPEERAGLVTLPRRGYRFVGPAAQLLDAFGTRSHDFLETELARIMNALGCADGRPFEMMINAALADAGNLSPAPAAHSAIRAGKPTNKADATADADAAESVEQSCRGESRGKFSACHA